MELQPKRQPGRVDRKAAAYGSEIARLRSAGYTYEAIREAMAGIGIELSTSALRREVRRLRMPATRGPRGPQPVSRPASPVPPTAPAPATRPVAPAGSSSRELAEAFFDAHPSNPLLRTKDLP